MQNKQFFSLESNEIITEVKNSGFPWSFIIFMLPGLIFIPFFLERYQFLILQTKNANEPQIRRCLLLRLITLIIIGLDITIWVHTLKNPSEMYFDNTHIFATVLYLILLLSWYLAQIIEQLELSLEQYDFRKTQHSFWIFSFFANSFQLIFYANVKI